MGQMVLQYSTRGARLLTAEKGYLCHEFTWHFLHWGRKAELSTPHHHLFIDMLRCEKYPIPIKHRIQRTQSINHLDSASPLLTTGGSLVNLTSNHRHHPYMNHQRSFKAPENSPKSPYFTPEKILTNTATVPILEQFLTNLNHIIFLIFIHPFPPILVWLPWFLHRWSRLHRRSLHLWRFWALRSSCSGRRRCRSHQRLGRWKTERAVISPTQTPNNAGLKGNSLQQYHTCNMGNLMTPGRCQKLFFQESYWRVES